MPMPMPPPGGLPGPMQQASPMAGGMTQQQGNHGNIQAAMMKIKNAVSLLQEALPMIPMGDDLHTEILSTAKNLSKHLKKGSDNPQLEMASMQGSVKNQAQNAPMAALMRQFSSSPAPGGAPATPQPQPQAGE